jgi:succinoglycan biosynthesis protein ExoA
MKSPITLVVPLGEKTKPEFLDSVNRKDGMKIIIERGENPSANRNKGIKKAKSPFVAFVNGHSFIAKDWHKKTIEFFKKHPEIDIVGGPQLNSFKDNVFGRVSGYALASPFGSGGIWKRYGGTSLNLNASETDLTSTNLICRKRVFDKIKFDEALYPGEDPKFIADAKKAGFRVAYSPDIKVANKRRSNILALSKQVFRYGEVRPQKESFFDTLRKPFFLVPAVFVLYLISLIFYSSPVYLLPLSLYIILMVAFTAFLSIKNKDLVAIVLLPLIFVAIHISYGLGMIYGLVGGK